MKTRIKRLLQQLNGLELTRTTRTANMECLKFGILYKVNHKGIERQIGQFGLHLQCSWRITKDNIIIVGDDDLYEQPNEMAEYNENFNWDIQGGNLRDIKLCTFINSRKHIISSVEADDFGGFELIFDNNIRLTVFPTLSSKSIYNEYWRFLDNRGEDSKHFVVNSFGIDEDNE